MCPQTLSRLSKSGNYRFGNSALTARPELGALVARAIAGWAVTETHLGNAFAELIGAAQPVTMSMYAAFRSFERQRQLLETAAAELLPRKYALMLSATLIVLHRNASTRHKFAHWIWGLPTDPGLGDALLLLEPRHLWKKNLASIMHWRTADVRKHGLGHFVLTQPRIDPKLIQVYRESDLLLACAQMEIAYKRADLLNRMIGAGRLQRSKLYNRLDAEAEIHSALVKHKKAQRPKLRSRAKLHDSKRR